MFIQNEGGFTVKKLFCSIISIVLCAILIVPCVTADGASLSVDEALSKLDAQFDSRCFNWLLGLYDPSGGMYYSESAREYSEFRPDIESTCQGIGRMLGVCGININNMPDELKKRTVNYLRECQDKDDGYFYDPQFGKNVDNAKRERNTNYAVDMIKGLGGTCKYRLPSERRKLFAYENKYTSRAAMKEWLDSLPWETNPYYACHEVSASFETACAYDLGAYVAEYVESKQDPETGLWGGGLNYVALSAAMKASTVFKTYTRPYPNVDKMLESLIYIVRNRVPDTSAMLCNPIYLLTYAKISFGDVYPADIQRKIDENMIDLIDALTYMTSRFKRSDGGFSYLPTKSIPISQGALVGLGLEESDVNGFALVADMRELLYRLNGRKAPNLCSVSEQEIWDIMLNKEAYPKKKYQNITFLKSGNEITSLYDGKIDFRINAACPYEYATADLIVCTYSGTALSYVKKTEVNLKEGANEINGSINISDCDNTILKVMLWDKNLRPYLESESISGSSSVLSLKLSASINGKTYNATVNPYNLTAEFFVDEEVSDKTAIRLYGSVPKGASVTPSFGDADFTKPVSYTVTSSTGDEVTFNVLLTDKMTCAWKEEFDGCEITDANKVSPSGRSAYSSFVPTFGTWNDGQYQWEYGMWMHDMTERQANANPFLSVVKDENNDSILRFEANGKYGELGYKFRTPAAGSNCVPIITESAVYEFEMAYDDFPREGDLQAGILYFGTGSTTFWNTITSLETFGICLSDGAKFEFIGDDFSTEKWYKIRIVAKKIGTQTKNDLYIDGKYAGSNTSSKELTFDGQCFMYNCISTTYGRLNLKNVSVIYK